MEHPEFGQLPEAASTWNSMYSHDFVVPYVPKSALGSRFLISMVNKTWFLIPYCNNLFGYHNLLAADPHERLDNNIVVARRIELQKALKESLKIIFRVDLFLRDHSEHRMSKIFIWFAGILHHSDAVVDDFRQGRLSITLGRSASDLELRSVVDDIVSALLKEKEADVTVRSSTFCMAEERALFLSLKPEKEQGLGFWGAEFRVLVHKHRKALACYTHTLHWVLTRFSTDFSC